MHKLITPLLLSWTLLLQSVATADIVVIVNSQNSLDKISRQELIDLYMGRYSYFENNDPALMLDLPMESNLRKQFYQKLIKKSVAEVNAYWARLLFTGRASPPKPIADAKQVVEFVRNNPNVIGYIYRKDIDNSVKMVYQFASD